MLVHSVTLMNTSKQLNRALLRYHQHPRRWLNFGRPCLLALLFPPVEKWIQLRGGDRGDGSGPPSCPAVGDSPPCPDVGDSTSCPAVGDPPSYPPVGGSTTCPAVGDPPSCPPVGDSTSCPAEGGSTACPAAMD
ncbi:hypothetical protein ACOMHN_065018 [Nucella lapillus]